MSALQHREIFRNPDRTAVELPLGGVLGGLGQGAGFPLVEDPRNTNHTTIVGMFVLRPANQGWQKPLLDAGGKPDFQSASEWCFNVRGVDGGWLIAGGNPLDAYRLALQYGLADAVIVGSNTVAKEGVDHGSHPGYLWQPYGPLAWPQLASIDPTLGEHIAGVRRTWQSLGVLSQRKYPAQIVVSQSGEHRPPANDLFQARIFNAVHPDGTPVETYVLTSEAGAARMRTRMHKYPLRQRPDDVLLVASPAGDPETLDIAAVPALLRSKLDIRIANHDGGQTVLSKFSEAGAMPQVNLTLMRGASVKDVLRIDQRLDESVRGTMLAEFDARRQLFFSGSHSLPRVLEPLSVLTDGGDGVVVSFDARGLRGL